MRRDIATQLTAINKRVSEAEGKVLEASRQMSQERIAVGDATTQLAADKQQLLIWDRRADQSAARAGDAGRGFAVVAAEVKSLAASTMQATGTIASRVAAIQASSATTIEAIGRIRSAIEQVNKHQQSIAGAVEEQAASTKVFTGNVDQVVLGSKGIAANIAQVASASERTRAGATETLQASTELSQQSTQLEANLARFSC